MANGQYANGNNEQYGEVPEAGGGSELPSGVSLHQASVVTERCDCRGNLGALS